MMLLEDKVIKVTFEKMPGVKGRGITIYWLVTPPSVSAHAIIKSEKINDKTLWVGIAHCHPDDGFDLNVGMKVSLSRYAQMNKGIQSREIYSAFRRYMYLLKLKEEAETTFEQMYYIVLIEREYGGYADVTSRLIDI